LRRGYRSAPANEEKVMIEGRCLCGTVRYEVAAPLAALLHCHCSMCRKHHGTAFVTWAVVPASGFRYTAGQDHTRRFASSQTYHRSFCTTCGAVTPEAAASGEHVVIPAGNLEGDPGMTPQLHMFVASKAPWYEITDSLPQHAEYPAEFGMQATARAPVPPARVGVAAGSCLCGAVAYEIDSPPLRFMYCHCSRCRLGRGAAHATNLFYRAEGFRWVRGAELVADYPLPGAQFFAVAFCSTCGSSLPRVSTERGVVNVPAGSLDTDPGMAPQGHIYVASKAPWDVISDAIPQFAEMPARR
jgi:hypothetical protein